MAPPPAKPTQDPTMSAYSTSDNVAKPELDKNGPGSGKEATQKRKRPQRGLRMAHLERLRMEEMWKKMTEMSPVNSLDLHDTHHQYPFLFPDPIPSVPVLMPRTLMPNHIRSKM